MSAEVSRFSKRAANELTRCFNGIATVSSRASPPSSTSISGVAASGPGGTNTGVSNKCTSFDNSIGVEQRQNAASFSMGTTTTTTRQTTSITNSQSSSASSAGCAANPAQPANEQPQETLRSFSARSLGGAFRVFKNSEKLLSPLKGGSNKSSNENVETNASTLIESMMTNNSQVTGAGGRNANSMMTPRKQSRHGPPPRAPPKTNRARRKNYLLNLQKATKVDILFTTDTAFLRRFFRCFEPADRCRLAQVCKTWCQILYSEPENWRPTLTFVIRWPELKTLAHVKESQAEAGAKELELNECHENGFSSVLLYSNNESTKASRSTQFSSLLGKWNQQKPDKTANQKPLQESSDKTFAEDGRKCLFQSIKQRRFESVCHQGACDQDLAEFVEYFRRENIHKSKDEKQAMRHLIIRHSSVTDQGLETLLTAFAPVLHSVELIGCNELTNSGHWASLVPNLLALTIQDCINVSDDTMATICQSLSTLEKLRFQAYHVTDVAMAYFSTSPMRHSLRVLTLQHCWEITNQGVANVAHSLPNLTSLSLSGCSKVNDDAIEVVAEQLRNLVSLDLSWCPRIGDAALEYIACDLADTLKTLVLDRCLHVTDIGMGYLATIANLEHLSIRWCPQIRDFGLQALTSLRSLKTLSIAGCTHVTFTGISFLARMRQLEEIELTNCPAASQDLIKYLASTLPESCTIITS